MLSFTKKFDHNDPNQYLCDSKTIGSATYYRNKFSNKFPDYMFELLEVYSREEYSEEQQIKIREHILAEKKAYELKLLQELDDRMTVSDEPKETKE